jgi:hypothetical protein
VRCGDNFIEAKRITLTRVIVREGVGTTEDPVCHVAYLVDEEGRLVAKEDPRDGIKLVER